MMHHIVSVLLFSCHRFALLRLERYDEAILNYQVLYERKLEIITDLPTKSNLSELDASFLDEAMRAFDLQPWPLELCYSSALLLGGYADKSFNVAKLYTPSTASKFQTNTSELRLGLLFLSASAVNIDGPVVQKLWKVLSETKSSAFLDLIISYHLLRTNVAASIVKYFSIFHREGANSNVSGILYCLSICAFKLGHYCISHQFLVEYLRHKPMSPKIELMNILLQFKLRGLKGSEDASNGLLPINSYSTNTLKDGINALLSDPLVSDSAKIVAALNIHSIAPSQSSPIL